MTVVKKAEYKVVSNNAKSDDTPAYVSGTAYKVGDRVKHKEKIWACARPTSKEPGTAPEEWAEMGNTNPTKFQDKMINSQTKNGQDNLEITINIENGFANAFAFFNVDARRILIYDQQNNPIYEKNMTTRDVSQNWWQYFYGGGFSFRADAWLLSQLDYSGNIKFVLEPNEKGANLGHLVVGKKVWLGHTQAEFAAKSLDYSKKIEDPWGNIYIRDGKKAKYADVKVVMPTPQIDFNRKTLENLEKPALFVGDERSNGLEFESLAIFGFCDDFEITHEGHDFSETVMSIQGVV